LKVWQDIDQRIEADAEDSVVRAVDAAEHDFTIHSGGIEPVDDETSTL
jgi:hypothetical protein